ncbi:hypothetical protein [Leptolyngbya iicbica]|uniref:Uncharacterized protein n=1 Tax=Lyngbya confervoides BDU141951 TaxID=1574623 RepID=A0A8T6QUW8_9CYAN|nr:hypothetical protein [Leptolyngbya sp. LK]
MGIASSWHSDRVCPEYGVVSTSSSSPEFGFYMNPDPQALFALPTGLEVSAKV